MCNGQCYDTVLFISDSYILECGRTKYIMRAEKAARIFTRVVSVSWTLRIMKKGMTTMTSSVIMCIMEMG